MEKERENPMDVSKFKFTLSKDKKSYKISFFIANEEDIKEVVIPSTYQGLPVTAIGEAYCKSLLSLRIPSSIQSIDSFAFEGCSKLASVYLPASVTHYGYAVFADCEELSSIEVDPLNPVYKSAGNCLLSKDGKVLLQGCKTSLIPDSVVRIGTEAFCQCSGLTTLRIPSSVKEIGFNAFMECWNLTTFLPSSVTKIEALAFQDCWSIRSLFVPSSLTSINTEAFDACCGIASIEVAPLNPVYKSEGNCLLSKDGKTLLLGCRNSIIPRSVTTIAKGAFSNCYALSFLIIPSSVQTIEKWAFVSCTHLFGLLCEAREKPKGWDDHWMVRCIREPYWFSETPKKEGRYWHYQKDGKTYELW